MKDSFLRRMSAIHDDLHVIWPEGREGSCCDNDGRHYTLKNKDRPVSVGQVEARLLYNLAISAGVHNAFEIGTGFGYSSFWLGAAIFHNSKDSGWLGSLDNYSEGGIGQAGHGFALSRAKFLELNKTIHYYIGNSPEDLSKFISKPIDLALIDGNHNGAQPLNDYKGLRPFFSDSAILIWHDVQRHYDVGEGLALAIKDGWSPIVFPTSCRLCVCYKTVSHWDLTLKSFENARELILL